MLATPIVQLLRRLIRPKDIPNYRASKSTLFPSSLPSMDKGSVAFRPLAVSCSGMASTRSLDSLTRECRDLGFPEQRTPKIYVEHSVDASDRDAKSDVRPDFVGQSQYILATHDEDELRFAEPSQLCGHGACVIGRMRTGAVIR